MNTKVYVDGGIVITTPYFKYEGGGSLYTTPPEGAEIIIPKDTIEGKACLIISENEAPSFFKEYYAKTFFSTKYLIAPFFGKNQHDCFIYFDNKINEVLELLEHNDVFLPTQQNLYRLSIVSTVAALDTLISDLVLYVATKDRNAFLKTIDSIGFTARDSAKLMERILRMWCDNAIDSAEQEVVNRVLQKSYSSMSEIKNTLKTLYDISIPKDNNIEHIIHLRHLIAHRNGRKKDGTVIELSRDETFSMINQIKNFAHSIKIRF